MLRLIKIVHGICFLMLLGGCSNGLSFEEYTQFLSNPKNGYRQKINLQPYQLEIEYQPAVYTAYRKSGGDSKVYQKFLKEDKQLLFFQMKLGLQNGGDMLTALAQSQADYQDLVYYFSYTFQKGIFLKQGKHKYPCVLFHFERSYDLHGSKNFVLAFENNTSQVSPQVSPGKLCIEAPDIGIPLTEITFEIQDIPELTL